MTTTYDEVLISLGLAPSGGPRKRQAQCGSPSGYNRHRANGEEPCTDCRAANAAYKRARYHHPKNPEALPPIKHGTPNAARQHWYRGERACDECREAYYAWHMPARTARRRRTRLEKAQRPDLGGVTA